MPTPLSMITLNSSPGALSGMKISGCRQENDVTKVRNVKDVSSSSNVTSGKGGKRYYSEGRFYGIEQFVLFHCRPDIVNKDGKLDHNCYHLGRDATEDEVGCLLLLFCKKYDWTLMSSRCIFSRQYLQLNLSFLPVQNTDLIHIASISDSLRSLDLSHCRYVGDMGIKYLHVLKGLTKLKLSGCSKVTDASCRVLRENLNRLKELDLSDCNVSDRGIIEVLEGCLYLESISIRNNSSFTDKGLEAIQTNMTLMKLLHSLGKG